MPAGIYPRKLQVYVLKCHACQAEVERSSDLKMTTCFDCKRKRQHDRNFKNRKKLSTRK